MCEFRTCQHQIACKYFYHLHNNVCYGKTRNQSLCFTARPCCYADSTVFQVFFSLIFWSVFLSLGCIVFFLKIFLQSICYILQQQQNILQLNYNLHWIVGDVGAGKELVEDKGQNWCQYTCFGATNPELCAAGASEDYVPTGTSYHFLYLRYH